MLISFIWIFGEKFNIRISAMKLLGLQTLTSQNYFHNILLFTTMERNKESIFWISISSFNNIKSVKLNLFVTNMWLEIVVYKFKCFCSLSSWKISAFSASVLSDAITFLLCKEFKLNAAFTWSNPQCFECPLLIPSQGLNFSQTENEKVKILNVYQNLKDIHESIFKNTIMVWMYIIYSYQYVMNRNKKFCPVFFLLLRVFSVKSLSIEHYFKSYRNLHKDYD